MGLEAEVKGLKRASHQIGITDGPVTASNEVMGSAFVIEAIDLEDAIRVASLHPTVQVQEAEELGWRLEVRPVHYYWEQG